MTLGDAWGREPDIEPDPSVVSADYLRAKIIELQVMMNSLDESHRAADAALSSGALTLDSQEQLATVMAQYLEKRDWLRGIAQSVNVAAEAANAVGLRMPVLAIPRTLGAVPLVGLAVVIATAAAAITWGQEVVVAYNERLRRAQLIEAATPEQRARVIDAIASSDAATQASQGGVVAQVAPLLKWLALGAAAWVAYQAWTRGR